MINVNKKVRIIAKMCHEANRAIQVTLGEEVNPPWDQLSDDLKDSTYTGVLHALDGAHPHILHEKWVEERISKGWSRGYPLDREKKVHPNLVPYADLPVVQKIKDAVFVEIVHNYER